MEGDTLFVYDFDGRRFVEAGPDSDPSQQHFRYDGELGTFVPAATRPRDGADVVGEGGGPEAATTDEDTGEELGRILNIGGDAFTVTVFVGEGADSLRYVSELYADADGFVKVKARPTAETPEGG